MIEGTLHKLQAHFANPIEYSLCIGDKEISLNNLIGEKISLEFGIVILCIHCGRKTPKSYNQGYCFLCMRKLARCDICMVRPELCHYAKGTCREPSWGEAHCLQPHIVYLANTSGLKVGITRQKNLPYRWIDQGAVQALPIFKVWNRLDSGLIETRLAQTIPDKTNWRKMLKEEPSTLNLKDLSVALKELIIADCKDCKWEDLQDEVVSSLAYPILEYPTVIKSLNLDKNPLISDILIGIKGQYLLFKTGVLNIKNCKGYTIKFF